MLLCLTPQFWLQTANWPTPSVPTTGAPTNNDQRRKQVTTSRIFFISSYEMTQAKQAFRTSLESSQSFTKKKSHYTADLLLKVLARFQSGRTKKGIICRDGKQAYLLCARQLLQRRSSGLHHSCHTLTHKWVHTHIDSHKRLQYTDLTWWDTG